MEEDLGLAWAGPAELEGPVHHRGGERREWSSRELALWIQMWSHATSQGGVILECEGWKRILGSDIKRLEKSSPQRLVRNELRIHWTSQERVLSRQSDEV